MFLRGITGFCFFVSSDISAGFFQFGSCKQELFNIEFIRPNSHCLFVAANKVILFMPLFAANDLPLSINFFILFWLDDSCWLLKNLAPTASNYMIIELLEGCNLCCKFPEQISRHFLYLHCITMHHSCQWLTFMYFPFSHWFRFMYAN